MSIQLAIATLQQYKLCSRTEELSNKYPFEMKRRMGYIDNLVMQLAQSARKSNSNNLLLIADDIRHCLLQKYYPLLPRERETDNFNFAHTMEDVERLIEINSVHVEAA